MTLPTMKFSCFAAVAIIALGYANSSRAEEPKPLTIEQTIAVTNGLAVIGGCKDGSPAANKTCELYDLKPSVRWTIAMDIARGRDVGQHYNEQCDAITQSLGGERCAVFTPLPASATAVEVDKQTKAIAAFNRQVKDLMAPPSGIVFGRLHKADLNMKDDDPKANRFPVDALSMILPIVDE